MRSEPKLREAIVKSDKLKESFNDWMKAPTLESKCVFGLSFIDNAMSMCLITDSPTIRRRRDLGLKFNQLNNSTMNFVYNQTSLFISSLLIDKRVSKYLRDDRPEEVVFAEDNTGEAIGYRHISEDQVQVVRDYENKKHENQP